MKTIFLFLCVFVGVTATAQIPNFSLVNSIDGKTVSLNDYKSGSGVVVIFISTTCPYDEYYYGRIGKLVNDYGGKANVILINPNANETMDAMKRKMAEAGIAVPYLMDNDQLVMKSLNASKTPEAFVLKNKDGQYSVFYHGAIDDNAQVETDVKQQHLVNAINALLASRNPEKVEVRPVGCSIHKK